MIQHSIIFGKSGNFMKSPYISSVIESFCKEIEVLPDALQEAKITSIYHTLFEIGKTDIAAFIDGFFLFEQKYAFPLSYKEKYMVELLPENLKHFKQQYPFLKNQTDYSQKYNLILDKIWHCDHRSQNLILRNLFDTYYLPVNIGKHVLKHLQKELLWGQHSLSQGLYFGAIDELLDFWLIEPTELISYQDLIEGDTKEHRKINRYNLAVYALAILLAHFNDFTREENNYFKRSVNSLFNKLQQRFPNCYVSYAHQTNINLLRYTYLNPNFLEIYFHDFFSSFVKDFLNNKDDLAQQEIHKFLMTYLHVNTFPYNSVVNDQESFIKQFQEKEMFIKITKAFELKNFYLDKYSFLALTYKELEYQELLIKSYNTELYTYFFNQRLQYQLSKKSLCFDLGQQESTQTTFHKI